MVAGIAEYEQFFHILTALQKSKEAWNFIRSVIQEKSMQTPN